MFAAVFLSLVATNFAAHPGFTSTGNVEWRNCGNPADDWISVSKFDITPTPIKVPGKIRVDLDSKITHELKYAAFSVDFVLEKDLLGIFTKIVCVKDLVGTCHYNDPCHFLHSFNGPQGCPKELAKNGLPCTCPISAQAIKLHNTEFPVDLSIFSSDIYFLVTGSYHIKVSMTEKATSKVRACFETYLKFQH